ncbi:uncharacterized protein LOC143022484 [Oratosquilla oratoria]|uniref:uncharacterized protein LOC143022484 n=1 Tax=Oratosquilla oratoria TaxID=337810 RepID=UPI003F763DE3
MDESMFKNLFVSLVRPHSEYANQVCCPYKERDIAAVEAVQRRATKMVPGLRTLTYSERLKKLGLPTLTYRRSRGNVIETFKIITGVYDEGVSEGLFVRQTELVTRGHNKGIFVQRTRLNIRKYTFSNRVVNNWNKLPEDVVNAKSVVDFERKLDRVWKNQEQKYDFEALIVNIRLNHSDH